MGLDFSILLAITTAIGGLIAWIIVQVKEKLKSKIELEQRISAVETQLAVNAAKDENLTKSMNEILDTLKELRNELKTVTASVNENNIDIAILKSKGEL